MNVGPPHDSVRAAAAVPGAGKSRWRRPLTPQRMLISCLKITAVVLVLAVVGAGILVFRLQQGPIEIDGLSGKIESALQSRFGQGFVFDLGHTSMIQKGFGPTLAADKLAVSGPDRQTILSAPRAEVSIDLVALAFGKVVPKRVEVMDVTLRLVLLKNGSLAVAAGEASKPFLEIGRRPGAEPSQAPRSQTPPSQTLPSQAAQSQAAPAPAAPDKSAGTNVDATGDRPPAHRAIVMQQASAAIRQFLDILTDPKSAIAAVDRLGITRGKLVIDDQMTNEEVVYSDLDLAFDKARGITNLTLSAKGPNGRWAVSATAKGTPGAARTFGLKAENLTIDEAQLIAGSRSLGIETDMPIAMTADIGLRSDNTISEAAGSFELGPGFFITADPDQEPFFVDKLAGGLRWNGEERRIEVEPTRYVEKTGSVFTFAGSIKPPRDENEPWLLALATTEPGTLAPDRKGQETIPIEKGQFNGRLFLDRKTFLIDRFAISSKAGGIALAGQFDWIKGPHVKIGARIDPTSVGMAQRVWPAFMASSVRAWVLDHFETGQLTEGTIQVDYDENALKRLRADRAPPDQSVALDFKLSKASLRFLDGVPPVEDVEGIGHITGRSSRFELNSGTITVGDRKIGVSNTLFLVPSTVPKPTPATLSARLSGSVEAIADILSREALRPYASLPLDAATVHGQVDGTLEKTLMLGAGGESAASPMKVTAKVSDFRAERIVGTESLEEADLDINVEAGKLKATGQGKIFGGPATFEIDRVGTEPPSAKIAVTLDEAARAKLGLSAIPGLAGPMTAHVNASLGDPSKIRAQVDLDLAKTSVVAAYLGLRKPPGRPAKVSFTINPRDNRLAIEQLVIDIASLQARGAVDLDSDNAFQGARFSSFKVSPGDDMRLDVSKGDDTFKLTIRGSTIDARPFLKTLTSTPASDATPISRSAKAEKKEIEKFKGFDVDLKTGILTGFNKEVMNAVDLKLSKRGAQYRQLSVRGRFGSDSISGSMDSNQRLKITARDAGALVSFIDLYKHMEGGDLSAAMQVSEDALDGNLEIHDFVLRDEPAIRRLVAQSETVSAPGEDTRAAKRINAGAVGFKRLKVSFERAGSRLQLHDATMYGNEIGLSVDGWLDYVHDRVSMSGTFVPVYALNNMFAQIPVFGLFLGGKSNEGLLAITFKISGLASTPTLSINPLSVVTPGFLRNIFGALDQGGAVPPDADGRSTEPTR